LLLLIVALSVKTVFITLVNGGRGCAFIDCIYEKYVVNLAKGKNEEILWLDKIRKK